MPGGPPRLGPMSLLTTPRALFALLIALSASACLSPESASGEVASAETQQANQYTTNGVVRGIDRDRLSITIQHEDVPGYMPAMTMPFSLRSASQVDGLDVNDNVRFTFAAEGGGRHAIVSITKR